MAFNVSSPAWWAAMKEAMEESLILFQNQQEGIDIAIKSFEQAKEDQILDEEQFNELAARLAGRRDILDQMIQLTKATMDLGDDL